MILLTGGTGQVGRYVANNLKRDNLVFVAPTRAEFNLNELDTISTFLVGKTFKTVLHVAAETNVDLCESDPEGALRRNFESTKMLAEYCALNGSRFVFVSSAGALSGEDELMHLESATPSPCNVYAESKALAEDFIRANNSNYVILRAAWMLGKSSNVKKFAELMVEKISANQDVSAVFDKFGSLTSARRFANLISTLIDSDEVGTFNIGSRTPCSRYDVAKEIAWRLSSKSNVEPVPSSMFKLPAPRGFSEGLDSTQAQLILGYEALKWEDELQEFMNELNIGG